MNSLEGDSKNKVIIFPFNTSVEPEFEYLSESAPKMLLSMLEPIDTFKFFNAIDVLSKERISNEITEKYARAVARKFGASYFIIGNIKSEKKEFIPGNPINMLSFETTLHNNNGIIKTAKPEIVRTNKVAESINTISNIISHSLNGNTLWDQLSDSFRNTKFYRVNNCSAISEEQFRKICMQLSSYDIEEYSILKGQSAKIFLGLISSKIQRQSILNEGPLVMNPKDNRKVQLSMLTTKSHLIIKKILNGTSHEYRECIDSLGSFFCEYSVYINGVSICDAPEMEYGIQDRIILDVEYWGKSEEDQSKKSTSHLRFNILVE